ncbi:TRAP transporter large permease subunit [Rhodobaculum claviforme]|uniref:C4-dicarboxylate ABC transporter permease n=1 Tax=Rhodobaculum claviforme TaxID=1549854 RepID=A0A934WIY0_9RHOB|nr:TRAP transporter large permease subunit [Rhodobaculum claviforme]MBK5926968.1 C4-dicarboxylate ABC transporter permease [Rhodobaculum claviforme]
MEFLFLVLLVGLMMLSLGLGFPVAFALPGAAIVTIGLAAGSGVLFAGDSTAYFMHGSAIEWLSAGVTNFRGIYWEADRDTLIAIPLFVFMGIMLQRSRIAEELLVTMARLFGALPGGLGISVIVVGALLAATTGVVGATVVAMGLISLPAMMRNNYSQPLATGTILASGTLGQIIPPSIVLIILADQLSSAVDQAGQLRTQLYRESTGAFSMPSELGVSSTSAGDMFMGALLPGLILVALYISFVLIYALIRPQNAPAVGSGEVMDAAFWRSVAVAVLPPLVLILLVLGSILAGVATVTQAGAVGAAGATVMAGYKLHTGPGRFVPTLLALGAVLALGILSQNYNLNVRQLDQSGAHGAVALAGLATAVLVLALVWSTWRTFKVDATLRGVMVETAKTSSLVFIILLGAAMLISAFRAFGGEILVKEFLTGLPGGFWVQFLLVMLVIFLLGFFLDFIEIAIVVVPIVAPILLMNPEANVSAVWLGVMIGLNIQTSFLTPPFGFALFYLRGVAAASVRTINMYKGVIPFIALQLTALGIVGFNPQLVNWLPARVSLLSENAPPPRNPGLQVCVEAMTSRQLAEQAPLIRERIAAVRAADTGMLPARHDRPLRQALDGMEESFGLMAAFDAATAAIEAATPDYRPLHREVSAINAAVSNLDTRIARSQARLRNYRGDDPDMVAERAAIEADIAAMREEQQVLRDSVPERWEAAQDAFQALVADEQQARMAFRRAAEPSYTAVSELAAEIAAADAVAALLPEVEALPLRVATADPEDVAAEVQELERRLLGVAGQGELASALSGLRRALTGRGASPEAARTAADEAVAVFESEAAWRSAAQDPLQQPLTALEAASRSTLGLRLQDRFARAQALEVARCVATHRDVSLRF